MNFSLKQLTVTGIDSSPEVRKWVSQFADDKRVDAKSLLEHLRFVSRDYYSAWFEESLESLPPDRCYAIYAIRKISEDQNSLWDGDLNVVNRPGVTLGSEDLVYSLIANSVRLHPDRFKDHPSLEILRDNRIHDIVLVDDSIGSGKRVSEFIKAMMVCPTFRSWWSYGLIRIHVLAFARTIESESVISESLPGSDHVKRQYPKSSKVSFVSKTVYSTQWLSSRWGGRYRVFLDLCDSEKRIPSKWRRGFGNVLGNIVFLHSVPNNIPGMLFYRGRRWNPLFPGRSVPEWLVTLLDNPTLALAKEEKQCQTAVPWTALSDEMMALLALSKSGVRRLSSIALRMDRDKSFVIDLIDRAKQSGLLLANGRITRAGVDALKAQPADSAALDGNWRTRKWPLYIPKSWCTGRVTVQPSVLGEATPRVQTEPAWDDLLAGGEAGQVSLERSDAKAATPPVAVNSQIPSVSRKGVDSHGPLDSKDM